MRCGGHAESVTLPRGTRKPGKNEVAVSLTAGEDGEGLGMQTGVAGGQHAWA